MTLVQSETISTGTASWIVRSTRMPRYFFHLTDSSFERDEEGTVLDDVAAARLQAVVHAGETMRDFPEYVWAGDDLRIEVTDESGALLFTILMLAINAPCAADLARTR